MYQASLPSVTSTLVSPSTKMAHEADAYWPQPGSCRTSLRDKGRWTHQAFANLTRVMERLRQRPRGLSTRCSRWGLARDSFSGVGNLRSISRKAGLAWTQVVRFTSWQATSIQKGSVRYS